MTGHPKHRPEPGAPAPAVEARRRLIDLAPGVDRRFEAIVVWSAAPECVTRAAAHLRALGQAGALIGVIAPLAVDQLAGLLAWPTVGAVDLLLADSRGSGGAVVDEVGVHPLATHTTPVDLTALDRSGQTLVRTLVGGGLTPTAVERPPAASRTRIELDLPAVSPEASFDHRTVLDRTALPDLATEAASQDVAAGMLEELWGRGVDSRDVLILIDGVAELRHRLAPDLLDVGDATAIAVKAGRVPPPAGVVSLTGGSARLQQLLADQLRRRRQRALPGPPGRAGWSLVVNGVDTQRERGRESLLTLADGHIGTSGAPLVPDPSRHPWVVAAGVYDGDGADTRLLTGPRVFELAGTVAGAGPMRRILDLRTGALHERADVEGGAVESVRFALLAQLTSVLRARYPRGSRPGPPLLPSADDSFHDRGRLGGATWIRVAASEGGIVAAARQTCRRDTLDRIAVYQADPDTLPDPAPAVDAVDRADNAGFDRLLARQRRAWARRWQDADVVVEGDDELQFAIRFALFHLMASVADRGEAAVGARGLTGTGYRGHVFWDADIFVLPFFAATHPASARAMLEYRLKRLPAAMEAARAAGRAGARFPWESAHSGRDVTPTSTRDRAGRIVPIRTGRLEEHIVADVAWAACCYVDWSGDEEFARGPGRRLVVETARYWASRIHLEPDGSAHLYGVIGPDEYHEPVDDNTYTNVMARWNLRRAAMDDGADDVGTEERRRWLEIADALVDGYDPDTGIYEQFAGFARLEPLIIKEVAPHRPIAADVLLGAERVARAQVIKQADVLLLHHLVPDEVVPGSLEPNLRFYESRTAHGSSLSPATHAALEARARDFDRALEALRLAARMDLDDLTGSAGAGLHLATMGGLWQALAFGFAGLRPRNGMLHVDPVLPPAWSALELSVLFRGAKVRIRKERAHLSINTDRRTAVVVGGTPFTAGPGKLEFRRRGPHWEPLT